MSIEQFVCMIFVPIMLLLRGISIYETNYMFGISTYLSKLSKKHNVEIDGTTYCRFEAIQTIKNATGFLILEVTSFVFEVKEFKTVLIILFTWSIVFIVYYQIKKKKFIKLLPKNINVEQ